MSLVSHKVRGLWSLKFAVSSATQRVVLGWVKYITLADAGQVMG